MAWRCNWLMISMVTLAIGCRTGGSPSATVDGPSSKALQTQSQSDDSPDSVGSAAESSGTIRSPVTQPEIRLMSADLPKPDAPQREGEAPAEPRALRDVARPSGSAGASPSQPPPAVSGGGAAGIPVSSMTISLSSAVSLALARNPDLVAQRQAEHVGSAAVGVAQTYPFNPFVQVQATPYQDRPTGGPGATYHYILLMQTIQLAHQQQFREEGACAALNTARWNIHQAELLNVAQTERLYFNALYQRGLRDLAQVSDANNQQLLVVLEKQLAAGQATAADAAIVRIDARSTRQQARLAQANYLTALRDLRRHLNLPPDAVEEPAGNLTAMNWRPASVENLSSSWSAKDAFATATDAKGLIVGYAGTRPDVMAARSDVDAARAGLSLASASRTPDLQVGPYYQRTADGTSFLGFRAQMDLPVVNSGVPLENQRNCELHQRVTAWQQLQTRAELEAQAAWERYELAWQTVTEEQTTQQASLPEELRRLEEQFKAGEVDVVRVVQARLSMLQNQRVYLDLLNELAQAAANLTATTGVGLETLVGE